MPITYADKATRILIEGWLCDNGDSAAEQIAMNLEMLYSVKEIHILSATLDPPGGDSLSMVVGSEKWNGFKEFTLDKASALYYDRR